MPGAGAKPLTSSSRPDFQGRFLEGIEHFNRTEFWEAHESWEELWLAAASDVEQFLQGLIQIAAAYHHVKRGTFPGAVRLFDAALRRLEPYPTTFCGLNRDPLTERCREHRVWVGALLDKSKADERLLSSRLEAGEFPRIELIDGWREMVPKGDDW